MKKFEERGVTLVAIAVDDTTRGKALVTRLGLGFPLLSDPDRTVIRAWGIDDPENEIAWPAVYIVGKDGIIAWRDYGESYKTRPASQILLEQIDKLPK